MTTVDYGDYTVTTTPTPTGQVVATTWKPGTSGANAESLRKKAELALQANAAYLGLASPTAAQNTAQIQRLTRECNALIRLAIGRFDADDA